MSALPMIHDGPRQQVPVVGDVWFERRDQSAWGRAGLYRVEAKAIGPDGGPSLDELGPHQSVGWGDGETCYLLYTKIPAAVAVP